MRTSKLSIFLISIFSIMASTANGQDSTYVLSATSFSQTGYLRLPDMTEWRFHEGNDSVWGSPGYDHSSWKKLDSATLVNIVVDENRRFEGWFTIRIKLDSSFIKIPLYLFQSNSAATDIYIDGELFHSFGNTNYKEGAYSGYRNSAGLFPAIALPTDQEIFIAVHFVEQHGAIYKSTSRVIGNGPLLWLMQEGPYQKWIESINRDRTIDIIMIPLLGLIAGLFWLIFFMNPGQVHLQYAAIAISLFFANSIILHLQKISADTSSLAYLASMITFPINVAFVVSLVVLIAKILEFRINLQLRIYMACAIGLAFFVPPIPIGVMNIILATFLMLCIYFFISKRDRLKGSKRIIAIGFGIFLLLFASLVFINLLIPIDTANGLFFLLPIMLIMPITLLIYLAFWLKEMVLDVQAKAKKVVQVSKEKKILLENQNIELERQVNARTSELNSSLENLKATQSQLIQSEKMASLGELTAGIAHEIQNPLNFVNNFSEVSTELVDEMNEEIKKDNLEEVKFIAVDLKENLSKIRHHGQRASGIVKGMLEHSRTSDGKKELADINTLADEYLRLAYHGLRAKDKSFNADFKTDFDSILPKIKVIPQDIGRVLLNLINNAFYAVDKKAKQNINGYKPEVIVSTKRGSKSIEIGIKDNGDGIPENIKDKIFQPFFTTKPTGSGTGLGLSLSYDIVKSHEGTISVESSGSEGTAFIITLPISL